MQKRELSLWVNSIFVIWIIFSFLNAFVNFTNGIASDSKGIYWISSLITIIGTIGIADTLFRKSIKGLAFGILIVVLGDFVVNYLSDDGYSVLTVVPIIELMRVIFLSLVLLIKKNGLSAWEILLSNDGYITINPEKEQKYLIMRISS